MAHRAFRRQPEDQQEDQIAQQVRPVRVQEQRREQAQHAAVAQRRLPGGHAVESTGQHAPVECGGDTAGRRAHRGDDIGQPKRGEQEWRRP